MQQNGDALTKKMSNIVELMMMVMMNSTRAKGSEMKIPEIVFKCT